MTDRIIPGQGWYVQATDEQGRVHRDPVLAFTIGDDGFGRVVVASGGGWIGFEERLDNDKFILTPPGGWPEPTPAELTGDELRGLLTKIDSFHTQVSRGFDEIQAKIADVIARDAAEAVRVRSDLAARKDRP